MKASVVFVTALIIFQAMAEDDYVVVKLTMVKESITDCEDLVIKTFKLINFPWSCAQNPRDFNKDIRIKFFLSKYASFRYLDKDRINCRPDILRNVVNILKQVEKIIYKNPTDDNFVTQLSELKQQTNIPMTWFTTILKSIEVNAVKAETMQSAINLGIENIKNKNNIKSMVKPDFYNDCNIRFVSETEASEPRNGFYYDNLALLSDDAKQFKKQFKSEFESTALAESVINYITNYDIEKMKNTFESKPIVRALKLDNVSEFMNDLAPNYGSPTCTLEVIVSNNGESISGFGKLLLTYEKQGRIVV